VGLDGNEIESSENQDSDNQDDENWLQEDEFLDEQEEVDLVAAVEWEGTRYNLVQLLEPVLVVGVWNEKSSRLEIPSSDELAIVFPLIEAEMESSGAYDVQ